MAIFKKEKKKEVEKVTATEEVVVFPEATGTPLPAGYDPDLPIGKQREFIGLV